MKDNRREFLKKAALIGGGIGLWGGLPSSIKKALAINPEVGSTFQDAEHVVFLMQENRSFDHCFGTLQGVRGFNDPRAIDLPNKNKVWLQQNVRGETFHPFRLNMKKSKATWMGGLPHSWEDQVDARNNGKYDQWLTAKQPYGSSKDMPLALGYYNREDIPFYYAFADSFTVCDQHFCSSLTGTTTNRMFFWTGTSKHSVGSPARVRNSEVGYSKEVSWKTFPERLEESGISWRVYQNELSVETDLSSEDAALLSNFTNNNLEWFSQYNVRFSPGHYQYLLKRAPILRENIAKMKAIKMEGSLNEDQETELKGLIVKLKITEKEIEKWSPRNFEKLNDFERHLHNKGLSTNVKDSDYHQTETLNYQDKEGVQRMLKVPKGDVFHEFRKDVNNGKLPTVSWLVAPQYFSDHPSAPWYGAWYVSEALEILTKNPEVWKKTIFILNYDENDGYFDHVPPYVAPNPKDINSGKISKGLDSSDEFVTLGEEAEKGVDPQNARESAVGLGFRVPLVVASPWSRGGWVNSEVCDITSTLLFLEKFLSKKFGKDIKEENISSWRRAICGDLTSVFRAYHGEEIELPKSIARNDFMKEIHNSRYKGVPSGFKSLSKQEIEQFNISPKDSPFLPQQEKGTRNSNSLPYTLYVNDHFNKEKRGFELNFESSAGLFGQRTAGAAFSVYAPGKYSQDNAKGELEFLSVKVWDIAVAPSTSVNYLWPIDHFENREYHLRVYGANGFYREFKGNESSSLKVDSDYVLTRGGRRVFLRIKIKNTNTQHGRSFIINNGVYDKQIIKGTLAPFEEEEFSIAVTKSFNWYDLTIVEQGNESFLRRLAGRVENGLPGKTDPLMGGVL